MNGGSDKWLFLIGGISIVISGWQASLDHPDALKWAVTGIATGTTMCFISFFSTLARIEKKMSEKNAGEKNVDR
jgi:hypothetical protein